MTCVRVAVGVVQHPNRGILIAKRKPGQHLSGLWEFPGGKIEDGETAECALQRELEEEVGITVLKCMPLVELKHSYPEKEVQLEVYRVTEFSGEAKGVEGQEVLWVACEDLPGYEFPEINKEIIERI